MDDPAHRIVTLAERPDLLPAAQRINNAVWPEFMLHDVVANRLFMPLYSDFPDFQFVLLAPDERVIAVGNSIPLAWEAPIDSLPDEGWDWALERGFEDRSTGAAPRRLCAISITIDLEEQGRGHSTTMVAAMRGIAAAHGLESLVAPVRPILKHRYPLTPIEHYFRWTTDRGEPFDPWMRVHARAGARIVRPCPRAMRIEGSIADWEAWTGLGFFESGPYVIPQALVPVEIDLDADVGRYVEPNVWMHHPVA